MAATRGANAPRLTSAPREAARHRFPVAVAVTTGCAVVLAVAVEVAPVVGGDLVAQAWWASWPRAAGTPVDFGWYGGVPVVSYSLLGPWLLAALGLPLAGILGTVLGAGATTTLLCRLEPSRARCVAAGVAAAATWAADQWSGRTTFGLGAALGCLALVVASRPGGRGARWGGAALAAVAGGVSPVASVFLLVAAAGWWCGRLPSGWPAARGGLAGLLRAGPAQPWWVAGGALLPLVLARLLGGVSGPEPAGTRQMLATLVATGLVVALVDPARRVVRAGAGWTALLLVATWLVSSPMGSNSVRLVLLFAVPVLVALARTPPVATALAVVAVCWLLPPLVVADLGPRDAGAVPAHASALVGELAALGPVGRVEVVPLDGHEESRWVAGTVPLARGWLRQLDTARSGLFYEGTLDPQQYLNWLRGAGVSYVALPSGALDWPAGGEAALLRRGVPGLREVWSDGWWRLYRVSGGNLLRGDARLVSSDRTGLVLDVPRPGPVSVAVWWSRWASLDGPEGCLQPGGRDGWTALVAGRAGRYTLTSSWRPRGQC